ncbi:MAG TPA: peptidoglycan editing factor PgeF [Smithellaceae bacterium]|nr:peptidoglycan editing factor PgeF [Smithellaceae bacterium]
MFTIERKKKIVYLQSSLLKDCDFLTHAFCTRQGGFSEDDYASLNLSFREGDNEYKVLQNWERLSDAFGVPLGNFLVLNQVHGDKIFVIKKYGKYFTSRDELDYDAIVCNRTNLAICIKTADCVPVFLVDRIKKIIAVAHAGWRGTAQGISSGVVRFLLDKHNCRPQDILTAIGPAIGRCCYQVDAPVAAAMKNQSGCASFLFPCANAHDRWMLDLPEANRQQIMAAGIPEENIETADFCTSCRQDLFFSHRATGMYTGRQINFMMIKEEEPCIVVTLNNNRWKE